MHFAVFPSDTQTHFTEASRYLHCENFQKNLGQKKMVQAASNSVILAQKKKSKTKQNKSKQLKNKQTN